MSYGSALSGGLPVTFWSTKGQQPGNPANEPFLQWLNDVAKTSSPPLVFSISYSDNEHGVESSFARRVNVELQKAGARGITIIDSSGDGGVGGTQPDNSCATFQPTFPAASPFVTAVGGTSGGATETGEYLSEGAAREWSTVVDISKTPPSSKPISLSLSRSPLSKTPKQVFFNPINIFDFFTHSIYCFIIYFFV